MEATSHSQSGPNDFPLIRPGIDALSALPEDLRLYIVFHFLSPKSLANLSACSRNWWWLVSNSPVWKHLCLGNGWGFSEHGEVGWMNRLLPNVEMNSGEGQRCKFATMLEDVDRYGSFSYGESRVRVPWRQRYGRLIASEAEYGRGLMRVTRTIGRNGVSGCMQFCGCFTVHAFADATLSIWATSTGEELHRLLGHSAIITVVQVHTNRVSTGSKDRTARLWDLPTGKPLGRWVMPSSVSLVRHDGQRVITGEESGDIRVWKITEGYAEKTDVPDEDLSQLSEPLTLMLGHQAEILDIVFDFEETILVSSSMDNTVRVWRTTTGVPIYVFSSLSPSVCLHLSTYPSMGSNHYYLAAGFADGSLCAWDTETGLPIGTCPSNKEAVIEAGRSRAVNCIQIIKNASPRLREVAQQTRASRRDPTFYQRFAHQTNLENGALNSKSLAPPFLLAAGCGDGSIRIHDLSGRAHPLVTLQGHASTVFSLEIIESGRRLDDLEKMEFSTKHRQHCSVEGCENANMLAVEAEHESIDLCSAGLDGQKRFWSMDDGKCRRTECNADSNILALVGYASLIQLTQRLERG